MALKVDSSGQGDAAQLIDENEQLRASLESALEENALLVEDRDQLRLRTRQLSEELRYAHAALSRHEDRASAAVPAVPSQGDTEEQSDGEAAGLGWLLAFHPDDRDAAIAAWSRAGDQGSLEIEGRIFAVEDGTYRHFRTRALPVRDGDGRVIEWLGTSTNVDDILQLRQQQDILVTELQHRTRNLMGVVQAVTQRTLRGVTSLEQFARCIDDRLSALARVQGLLSRRGAGARIAFDLLLREELSAHAELDAGPESKIALAGPEGVGLRSATVQTFALALHELATNAVEYGALSEQGGRLAISWGVSHDAVRGDRLWVDWRESGVRGIAEMAAPAQGGGYGRELIERALPYQLGARTSYGFAPDGVHCTIEVPISDGQINRETVDG